jgi:hypothetical protein
MAVRYEMIMFRQHRQTRSRIGVEDVKFITIVVMIGKISPQYFTAGFSSPGATMGVTTWTKIEISPR